MRGGRNQENENTFGILIMALKSFTQNMLLLGSGMGLSRAFSKFLEIAVEMNSGSENHHVQMVRSFDKKERYLFIEAYMALVVEMSGDGSGLVDVLGEFYSNNISKGRYIIPQAYHDLLPGILKVSSPVYRVGDYHCKTGRSLLAAAKFNRSIRFYGADPDLNFVRITLMNLCLNGLFGEVAWFDAKQNLFHDAWYVDLDYKSKPVIRHLPRDKSRIFQKHGYAVPSVKELIYDF